MLGRAIPITIQINQVVDEVPVGNIDGENTTFTLANTPILTSLSVYLNGLKLQRVQHYTITDNVIELADAPLDDDSVFVVYSYTEL
jgi:hypothetical protein